MFIPLSSIILLIVIFIIHRNNSEIENISFVRDEREFPKYEKQKIKKQAIFDETNKTPKEIIVASWMKKWDEESEKSEF